MNSMKHCCAWKSNCSLVLHFPDNGIIKCSNKLALLFPQPIDTLHWWYVFVLELNLTFRTGDTDQEETFFWLDDDFSGVSGIERTFIGCGGKRLIVFNEFALLCVIVFLVITGANLIFALVPFIRLLLTLKFAICFSILANRRPLSKLSISSSCENISAEKFTIIQSFRCNCFFVVIKFTKN